MSIEHTMWGFNLRGVSPAAKLLAIRIGECCTRESSVRVDIKSACDWVGFSEAEFFEALGELGWRGVDFGEIKNGEIFIQIPVKPHDFKPTKDDPPGALYVVTGEGRTKIGITRDLDARVLGLKTSVPFPIDLAFSLYDKSFRRIHAIEQETHRRLAAQRLSGEWFSISAFDAFETVKKVDAETPR